MRAKFIEVNESFVGRFMSDYDKEFVEVYKNPQTLKNLQPWIRACSDKFGNLYVADSQNILHSDLGKFLIKKGIHDNMIDWQRYKDTNKFYVAEGYDLSMLGLENALEPEELNMIRRFSKAVKEEHTRFAFISDKTILDSHDDL